MQASRGTLYAPFRQGVDGLRQVDQLVDLAEFRIEQPQNRLVGAKPTAPRARAPMKTQHHVHPQMPRRRVARFTSTGHVTVVCDPAAVPPVNPLPRPCQFDALIMMSFAQIRNDFGPEYNEYSP